MSLIRPLLNAVKDEGFEEPSPIQAQTIPLLLEGRDVLGCAQTGTGKTAAFALPILQRLSKTACRDIRTLILTPTRELAIQIHESFTAYGKYLPLKTGVIYGGVGQKPQEEMLRKGVDILVATPGRLNDLIGQGYVSLERIEIFVLDEADRMLDMGFVRDVKKILRELPAKHQTLLFSATMPKEIEELASGMLKNPATVKVSPVTSTVDAIRQSVYYVDKKNKVLLLSDLLRNDGIKNAIVFTKTKHGADRVVKKLNQDGIKALAIHGDKGQTTRQNTLKAFKEGRIQALIATDIAARGIDIVELSHVINYDIPDVPETYIHRIGRTGRAGLEGEAISFCNYDDLDNMKAVEKHIGKKIDEKESQWPMEIFAKTVKQPQQPRRDRGQAKAPSQSRGTGQTRSRGAGQTHSEGTGQTQSRGAGQTRSEGAGQTQSKEAGQTRSKGAGQTRSWGAGQTRSEGTGQTQSRGAGQIQSRGAGQTRSEGTGQTQYKEAGQTQSRGTGQTRSRGASQTQSKGAGQTRSGGAGQTHSGGAGQTQSRGAGQTRSRGAGLIQSKGTGQTRSRGGF